MLHPHDVAGQPTNFLHQERLVAATQRGGEASTEERISLVMCDTVYKQNCKYNNNDIHAKQHFLSVTFTF